MAKRAVAVGFLIIILIVAIAAVYLTFFYSKKCSDANCFNSALVKCSKANYINDAADASWFYKIQGRSKEECVITVKILQLKQGTNEMTSLEGKEMTCYTQLGVITSPQSNLAKCHGLLKEEMQSLIINKLHNYISSNLGQINEELTKAL